MVVFGILAGKSRFPRECAVGEVGGGCGPMVVRFIIDLLFFGGIAQRSAQIDKGYARRSEGGGNIIDKGVLIAHRGIVGQFILENGHRGRRHDGVMGKIAVAGGEFRDGGKSFLFVFFIGFIEVLDQIAVCR